MELPGGRATLGRVVGLVREKELTFIAAGVAYYAFVSLLPLAAIGIAFLSRLGSDAVVSTVLAVSDRLLTPAFQQLLRNALTGSQDRTATTLAGVVVFLWSGGRLVRAIDVAFSRVYDTGRGKSIAERLRDVAVVLVTITAAITVALLASGLVASIDVGYPHLIAPALVVAGVASVLVPLYYVLPNADIGAGEVVPGSVFTAVSWKLLEVAFRFYVGELAEFELYGVLGTVFLLLTWLYLGALALLLGAVVNAVLAGGSATPS